MSSTKKFFLTVAILALSLTTAGEARANLMGSILTTQYYANGGAYTGPTTFAVNGGVGANYFGYFNVVTDANSITFDFSSMGGTNYFSPSSLSLAPTIFNGITINLDSGPAFSSVSLDPVTNMTGFTSSSFSFTGSQIQVNFATNTTVYISPSTIMKLDVTMTPTSNGNSNVPEPADLALFALGFGVLVGMPSRKRNSRTRANNSLKIGNYI